MERKLKECQVWTELVQKGFLGGRSEGCDGEEWPEIQRPFSERLVCAKHWHREQEAQEDGRHMVPALKDSRTNDIY